MIPEYIKQRNEILDDYFVDEKCKAEIADITESLLQIGREDVEAWAVKNGYSLVAGKAFSLINTRSVSQQEIRDWATLNGYAMIKICSVVDRVKVEKVAVEIWGEFEEGDKYFLE